MVNLSPEGNWMAECDICKSGPMSLQNAKRHSKTREHLSRIQTKGNDLSKSCSVPNDTRHLPDDDGFGEADPCDTTMSPQMQDLEIPTMGELSQQMKSYFEMLSSTNATLGDEELPFVEEFDQWEPDDQCKLFELQGDDIHAIPDDREPDEIPHTQVPLSNEWAPYPSKGMCLTDLLFNSARMRFSDMQKKAILSWGKELGAQDVPSLYAFKKFQKESNATIGDPTVEKRSRTGNIFYLNEIGHSIAKDFANPQVRPHMTLYPEEKGNKGISQIWHGEKWCRQLTDDMLPPMAIHPVSEKHFYRDELAQCQDGSYFIPDKWFSKGDGKLWSTGLIAYRSQEGLISVTHQRVDRMLEDLYYTYEELVEKDHKLKFGAEFIEFEKKMPNPLRAKAKNRPVYHIFVIVFIDDVSGNISKQWNKHYVCYLSNANLPREELDKEYNVRFASSSPHVNAMELAQGIRESFENTKSGVIAYDCMQYEECLLRMFPIFQAADNPMHAEVCSQAGLTSNFFCRTCHAGGTKKEKNSDDGYVKLFESSKLRTPTETRDCIFKQFMRALQPQAQSNLEKLVRESGVKDVIAQPLIDMLKDLSNELYRSNTASSTDIQQILNDKLRELKAEGSIQNPFLEMEGFNVHLDTPTEVLHTVLLGVVKYFWSQTTYIIISNKKFDIFQARLESMSSDGLNIPRIMASYICQYRGSLIGKHFKSLVQLLPMLIHDLVHPDLVHAWLLMGRLMVLCWHTEIDDLDTYLELDSVIDEFLTKTAICAPSIILTKPKFHFLKHLSLYIRRFGPALLFSTERYEAYNSVFRQTSIYSNRMAPSRDTAMMFAQLDRVKHIASGGWWSDKGINGYTRASPQVLEFISNTPAFARLIGLPSAEKIKPGTVTLLPLSKEQQNKTKRCPPVLYKDLEISQLPDLGNLFPEATPVVRCRTVITQNGDTARIQSAVIVKELLGPQKQIGYIKEIFFREADPTKKLIIIQLFEFGYERHHILDLPTLTLTSRYLTVEIENLLCVVNVQHDCSAFECDTSGRTTIHQERQPTTRGKPIVLHKDNTCFILNMLALHNHHFLKELLPPSLMQPCAYFSSAVEHRQVRLRMISFSRGKNAQTEETQVKGPGPTVALNRARGMGGSSQQIASAESDVCISQTDLRGGSSLNWSSNLMTGNYGGCDTPRAGQSYLPPPAPNAMQSELARPIPLAGYQVPSVSDPFHFNYTSTYESTPSGFDNHLPSQMPYYQYPILSQPISAHPPPNLSYQSNLQYIHYNQDVHLPITSESRCANGRSHEAHPGNSQHEGTSAQVPEHLAPPKKRTRKRKAQVLTLPLTETQALPKKRRTIAKSKLSKEQLEENEQDLRDELF